MNVNSVKFRSKAVYLRKRLSLRRERRESSVLEKIWLQILLNLQSYLEEDRLNS